MTVRGIFHGIVSGSQTSSIGINWELIRNANIKSPARSTKSETLKEGPLYVFLSPPGGSDKHQSLRSTELLRRWTQVNSVRIRNKLIGNNTFIKIFI